MSNARQFLICDNELHAESVDAEIMRQLRERDGNQGSCWSGVWTDGIRFGVIWASPASDLFGQPVTDETPDGDPLLVIVDEIIDENGESDWSLVVPEPPPEETEP